MDVLQDDPVSLFSGEVHRLFGHDLLSLSQRDVVEVTVVAGEAHLLAEGLDVLERVHSRGEDEEHRGLRTRLLVRLRELDRFTLRVFASEFLFYE